MPPDPGVDLSRFLERWVESGEVTSAFGAVANPEATIWSAGVSAASTEGRAPPEATSLFDAASLTKPWIATLALRLDVTGALPLRTHVGEVWSDCAPALARRRLGDLLRHRGGFEPWTPLYRRSRSRDAAERLLLSGELVTEAPRRQRYSDLDFVLWGFAAERVLRSPLSSLLSRALIEPMGTAGVEVRPGPRGDIVPCLCDNAREVELAARQSVRIARRGPPPLGEPQDGNARFLGGLAGHAGLFVSAEAMLALGREWLAALRGRGAVLSPSVARAALSGGGEYALGWARRRVRGSAGAALAPASFGHIGFTGGSLWVDPERLVLCLLLAHRRTVSSNLNNARRRFHALSTSIVEPRGAGRGRGTANVRW